jgi:hypothetical protein
MELAELTDAGHRLGDHLGRQKIDELIRLGDDDLAGQRRSHQGRLVQVVRFRVGLALKFGPGLDHRSSSS